MARRVLRILPYKGNRDYQYYLDGLKVNGKRRRLFFTSEAEAKEELKKWDKRVRKEGEDALAISQELRILAARCAKRLEPFQKSIWDATEFYIEHLERMRGSVPVTVLFNDYLETKQRAKLSEKYLANIKQRLRRFVADFSDRAIKTLKVREIEGWLHGLDLSPQTVNNFRAIIGAFFEYAVRRELVEKNPVTAVEKIKVVDAAPEIFTPEQLARLLNTAPAELLPALAIQAFAGLRTSELLRLDWGEVHQGRGFITVSAKKAKTAKRRLIPIAPNLAEWLRPYASMTGPLWEKGFRSYHVAIRNLAAAIGLVRWPNNGLRHSFASYHLAKHQNAPQLALEMGHSTPRKVFDNYREVVAPEEAERYWIIRPNAVVDNADQFSTASLSRSSEVLKSD
jgi:integrase